MELKFIKGSIDKWASFNAQDENSFYVIGYGEGDGKIALYLGKELIASGNTVAALEAEIARAKEAEKGIQDALDALAGNGAGSVVEQIANALTEAKGYADAAVSAETADREAADSFLSGKVDTLSGVVADNKTAIEAALSAETDAREAADTFLSGKIDTLIADAKTYSMATVSGDELTALGANVKEAYKLVDEDGTKVGDYVKIYKDSALQKVELDGQELVFTYLLASGQTDVVRVDVSNFLAESEFADGLQVVNHVVSVKVAEDSEDFLTVDANGVKLSGVQDAIDTAVAAEKGEREAAITALTKTVDDNKAAIEKALADEAEELNDAIEAEASARTNADNALEAKITELSGVVVANETDIEGKLANEITARTDADTALGARIDALSGVVVANETDIEGKLANEITARTAADTAEADARAAADTFLSGQIETLSGVVADNKTDIEAALSAETDARISAITAEADAREAAIEAEASARTTADNALEAKITELSGVVSNNQSASTTALTAAIEAEASARTAADNALEAKIATEKARLDAFFATEEIGDAVIDTLKEIQDYISGDTAGAAKMVDDIAANKKAIEDEVARATQAESALTTAIEAEVVRAKAAESGLTGAINTEEARALAAESGLSAAIEAEADRAEAAESGLTAAINAEKVRAEAAESGLTADIQAEASARTAADNALSGRLDTLEGVTVTGKDAIVVSASGATENKEISLKLGTQPAANESGVVLSQDTNGLVAKLYWGTI